MRATPGRAGRTLFRGPSDFARRASFARAIMPGCRGVRCRVLRAARIGHLRVYSGSSECHRERPSRSPGRWDAAAPGRRWNGALPASTSHPAAVPARGAPFAGVLALRPPAWAIDRHAWTCVDTGDFRFASGGVSAFGVRHRPICRSRPTPSPCRAFHARTFGGLVRSLVGPHATVREVECEAQGQRCCRSVVQPKRLETRRSRVAARAI